MFAAILLWLFFACVAVQMVFAMLFIGMFRRQASRNPVGAAGMPPVSVIICARNEAEALQRYLPVILAQRYSKPDGTPLYEVIVVNDASSDDTAAVLDRLGSLYSHLRTVTIAPGQPRSLPGKKMALGLGLDAARYDHLLLTDADCVPATEFWLEEMTRPLREGKSLVAGYGAYIPRRGLLNTFVRWETLHTFLQYSSYTAAGFPYMAVGRNLACTRAALEQARQEPIWALMPSGDDDLLLRSAATADNTSVVNRPDAFTHTEAKKTWGEWKKQKQRHLSTGKLYRPLIRRMLGLYALSHGLLWLLFIGLLFTREWGMALMLMTLRSVLYWTIMMATARRMKEKGLWAWIPLCDVGWALYNFIFAPWILWKNKQQWT